MRTLHLSLAAILFGASLTACGAPESPAGAPVDAPAGGAASVPQPAAVPTSAAPVDAADAMTMTGMTGMPAMTAMAGMTGMTATGGMTEPFRAGSGGSALVGTTWQWMGTMVRAGQPLTPDDPSRYTLDFGADGTVAVVADCNAGTAPYTASDPSMTIDATALPKAPCAAGSSSTAFIDDLGAINSMVTVKRGTLMLTFSRPDGTFGGMRFEPAAAP